MNKHGSCRTVSLEAKKLQSKKTKYSPKVYNMLLLRSAADTLTDTEAEQKLEKISYPPCSPKP